MELLQQEGWRCQRLEGRHLARVSTERRSRRLKLKKQWGAAGREDQGVWSGRALEAVKGIWRFPLVRSNVMKTHTRLLNDGVTRFL